MSEINQGQLNHEIPNSPIVVIGGLLSFKTQWRYYIPILRGSHSSLPNKDRFLPIPDHGLGTFPEMIGELDEQLDELHERLERPVVLVGQSLGALMAEKLALKDSKRVKAVALLAGAHDGVQYLTPTGRILSKALGDPETADDLYADSDFMAEHRQERATHWPTHVLHRVISPTYDDLIPAPQGLAVDLPSDQPQSERLAIRPIIPRLGLGIEKRTRGIENLKWLRPILPAGHVDIAICPPVISNIHELSSSTSLAIEQSSEEVVAPSHKPAFAAA